MNTFLSATSSCYPDRVVLSHQHPAGTSLSVLVCRESYRITPGECATPY